MENTMNKDRLKFRVWDTRTKQYLNTEDLYLDSNGDLCVQRLFCGHNEMFHDVDHGTNIVEQCTGLKDVNGKLIYEGDILETVDKDCYHGFSRDKYHYHHYLSRDEYGYCLRDKRNFCYDLQKLFDLYDFEIIGNIHENTKLLEGKL